MSKRVADVLVESLQAVGMTRSNGVVAAAVNRIIHSIQSPMPSIRHENGACRSVLWGRRTVVA